LEEVKDIRAVIEKNKLVIFVGAGVSQNSGIPTWSGLITEFAKKLKYDNCNKCTHKKKGCKSRECQDRYCFTQDEFLRIPQYYFNSDKSKGQKKYHNLIFDTLQSENGPNPLNDMIIKLLPKHIITTNYDSLLENSKNPNTILYSVIIEDKDLLTHISNNYIIKMHGDLNKPETIVLKEDDYLNYQQEHILIETFIKSLLIDHTFLFVGYSLNDYNLKLIMSWIEYFAKEHSVKGNRPRNYIIQVQDTPADNHIEKYFESNNIFILSTYDLPTEVKEKYLDIALHDSGKEVYAILDYIYDDKNDYLLESLSETLYEKYKIFDGLKRISFEDLLAVYSFGRIENIGGNLYFYEEEKFLELKPIIQSVDDKENSIKKVFVRAGISAIQYKQDYLSFKEETEIERTIDDELFDLYLNNEYFNVIKKLNDIKDDNLVAYYYYLVMPNMGNLNMKLDEIEQNNTYKSNVYSLIIYKYNRIGFKQMTFQKTNEDWTEFENIINNIPKPHKKVYGFIDKLHNGMIRNRLECASLFDSHEVQFTKKDNTVYFNDPMANLLKLQSLVYDYYFYFKYNNLMIDYFSNPKTYFEPYIKAILCTYSALKDRNIENMFGFTPYLGEYKLNAIDFDILIKYTDNKLIKSCISDYKVKKINFEDDVNIINKFVNLCSSIKIFGNRYNYLYLSNYLFVLTKCDCTDEDKEKIITTLGELIQRDDDKANAIIIHIFEGLEYIIKIYRNEIVNSFYNVLYTLLHIETIKLIKEQFYGHLASVFESLSKYADTKVHDIVDMLVDSQNNISDKLEIIYILHQLFSETQKTVYMGIVEDNINLISSDHLYRYLVEQYLNFSDTIKEQFINIVEREVKTKIANPGQHTIPDWLSTTLEYCVLLHLLKIWEDVDCLRPFIVYSDYLAFILDSNNFDYTKIDTSNYMWTNMFRSSDYNNILMSHIEIITPALKKAIENGYATDDQKKILYKYLLTEQELWSL